jgi:hypothetical protein
MERDALVAEVLELATACQTGQATEDERARLERLLEDNEEARSVYLRIADDTVTLNDVREARFAPSPASDAAALDPEPDIAHGDRVLSSRVLHRWKAVAALAASIAILAFGMGVLRSPSGTFRGNDGATFARIVSLSDVRWTNDDAKHREWERIGVDQALQFESGSVEVLYDNGVQFVVQGPANCRFKSEQRVEADAGKFVARVSPDAIGFEIVTPHAKVIDLGTSFGVTIDPNRRTDVVVYEGMVDLLPDNSPSGKRRLGAGEAMSIRSNGQVGRIATVRGGEFLPPPRVPADQADDNQVIASVTDNLKFSDTANYYRVIAGGFREDCPAYVDRMHQWNGLDDRGIPPFLRRGDYVMTFNDDKTQHNLRIAVELAQPARLYLLVDDRAEAPQWLTDSFTDTGWDIGIDEGFADVENVETAIGAGRSIEWTFSVWSRDVIAPSTVLLGSLQKDETAAAPREVLRAMYGIVATPLVGTVPAAEGPATTD